MRSINFTKEVEIDIDIYDVWEKMRDKDKDEFYKKEKLMPLISRSTDEWQDFVYLLSDEDAKTIMTWIKFYGKVESTQ